MTRLLIFIVVIMAVDASMAVDIIIRDYDVIHVVDNHNTCSRDDARSWANGFVNCFINKKYKNSPDLFNIVTKLLDHSKACIKFATVECRPNYDGFMHIMGKVIEMIKEYSNMHLERLMNAGVISYSERDKIKDFECIENSLTKDIYANCFSSVISTYEQLLGENETYDLIFQKEVESAILCTNIAYKQCSKAVKIDLNKVVRYILGVKQPDRDDTENDRLSSESLSSTVPSKLPSELQKTGKEKMEDNSEVRKLPDIKSSPNTTEFRVTEPEKTKSNLKVTNFPTLSDFAEEESDRDKNLLNPEEFLNSTENPVFIEREKVSNQTNPKKENLENDTKITDDIEITKTPLFPDFSKSIDSSKPAESSHFSDLPNSTSFDASESTVVEEIGKDTEIDLIEWEEKSSMSLEPEKFTELFESSTFPIPGKKVKNIKFTAPPDITESPNPKDLSYSISLDDSNSSVVAETEEDILIDSETINWDAKSTVSSKSPKLTDPSMFVTSTIPPQPTVLSKSTTSTRSSKTTVLLQVITSTIPPKPTILPKSTRSTKPPLQKSTASARPFKPSELPKSTASARPFKPSELPKSTTSKRTFITSSTEYFRSRYDPPRPRPTEPPRRPWYDYIIQPFVSLWRTIKSWFGW